MTDEEMTPVERLEVAVQNFVNEVSDRAVLVQHALLVWEQVRLDDDGDACRKLQYALVTSGSASAGLGLAVAGKDLVSRDLALTWYREGDDDD